MKDVFCGDNVIKENRERRSGREKKTKGKVKRKKMR